MRVSNGVVGFRWPSTQNVERVLNKISATRVCKRGSRVAFWWEDDTTGGEPSLDEILGVVEEPRRSSS